MKKQSLFTVKIEDLGNFSNRDLAILAQKIQEELASRHNEQLHKCGADAEQAIDKYLSCDCDNNPFVHRPQIVVTNHYDTRVTVTPDNYSGVEFEELTGILYIEFAER